MDGANGRRLLYSGSGRFLCPSYHGGMALELRTDFAAGTMGRSELLTDGSTRVSARLARTGVQVYTYTDGSTVREYRPDGEVFARESMETFRGLALTVGHPSGPVTPDNWAKLAVGHIGDNVKRDSTFLASDIVVKDAATLARIDSGELVELSAGYFVEIDRTPGVTPEGERYDQVQRNIRANHIALGPKGWGRAGGDVRLYTGDSTDGLRSAVSYCTDRVLEPRENRQMDTVPKADYDKAIAERDALAAQLAATKVQAEQAAAAEDSKLASRVALRVAAIKVDSALDVTKSDREIMIATIAAVDPDFKSDSRSDDYLRARFDIACERAASAPTGRVDSRRTGGVEAIAALASQGGVPRDDADDGNAIERAKAKARERSANDWKKPIGATLQTVK